ncbi:MAG TPA: isoaspartyl peptidase/L-asparaginase [Planctomycetota bacterium]|nr:isoaspartyl peptidase/L-asparaginase [Planctomycetota bacterium]
MRHVKHRPIIAAHAGAGSPNAYSDGTQRAVQEALRVLKKTKSPLKAVIAGTVILENDPRFNAGTGANLRMDGQTIEMDSAVMDSDGNCGAVACIQMVKNPVLVAELVARTPHVLMCGEGAVEFARLHKVPVYNPITPKAMERFSAAKARLVHKKISYQPKYGFESLHNKSRGCDTVGVVVSDGCGNFAAATSTGGISYMTRGRIGDSPLVGCGIYVGKSGAVVATGIGEEIIRRLLSKQVYDRMENGMTAQEACEWGLTLFKNPSKSLKKCYQKVPVGIVAVNLTGYGIVATQQMARGVLS